MIHVVPDVWGMLLEYGLQFVQWCCTHNSVRERGPICTWMNEIAQYQFPSCLRQAHSNRPGTGPGYENTEPGCILTIWMYQMSLDVSIPLLPVKLGT